MSLFAWNRPVGTERSVIYYLRILTGILIILGSGFISEVFAQSPPNAVRISEDTDEGILCFKIEMENATLFLDKEGGGLVSMIDNDGNDWISYRPGGGSAGEFRGIPNSGELHPGYLGGSSTTSFQLNVWHDSVVVESSRNNEVVEWTFFPSYVKMKLKSIGGTDGRYWVLYEGTPGGSIESSDSLWLSTGNRYSINSNNPFGSADITNTSGIADGSEWMYVTDGTLNRALYMAITDENNNDTYYLMENNMTVFGFGRQSVNQLRTDVNSILVFGLVEDKSPVTVENKINNSWNYALATEPLEINNISVIADQNSATISWTTNKPATSRVDYGLNSNYTNFAEDLYPKTNHSLVLNGLDSAVQYHYQITSNDSFGSTSSSDRTFITEALTQIVSDDFHAPSVNTSLWTLEDPLGGASVQMTGIQANISIPGGQPHNPWTSGNTATRLMQPAGNSDFEVEVKFESGLSSGKMYGIMIEETDSRYLRFDLFNNGSMRIFSAYLDGASSNVKINSNISIAAPAWLRVRRVGNQWTYSYSSDGSTWITAVSFTQALVVNEAGILVGNFDTSPAHTATVDYFFNTASPIVPEDGDVSDTIPPVISNVMQSVTPTSATITWTTDELSTSRVDYGLSEAYTDFVEISGLRTNHSLTLNNLDQATTYHFQVSSTDANGNQSVEPDDTLRTTFDMDGPVLDVWHGLSQKVGHLGNAQDDFNLMGNVSDDGEVTSLVYSLNGGAYKTLNIGDNPDGFGDGRRLAATGDFNADIPINTLNPGNNQVVLLATDDAGNQTSTSVTIDLQTGSSTLPYEVDWTTVSDPQDVGQYVDGKWMGNTTGVRTERTGYDRLFLIGEKNWADYEVTVPVTVYGTTPTGPSSGESGFGIIMRFTGHVVGGFRNFPQAQPKWGYQPFGCIGWIRGGNKMQYYPGDSDNATNFGNFNLVLGTKYWMKMRAQTLPDNGNQGVTQYSWKIWADGSPEPASWNWEVQQTSQYALRTGGIALVAHHVDAEFGDITVDSISSQDETPPVISGINTTAGSNSATISWTTNELTFGRVDFGLTSNYTDFIEDGILASNHAITINDLDPETTYHFQITSTDIGGNDTTSADLTFTTNQVNDAILPLDEGSGTIAGDVSGAGNDGTLLGGAAFEPTSGDGSSSSVRFDGVDDYIDLGALDVTGGGLTLACWLNGDGFPGPSADPRLISKASGTAGNQHVFMLGTINSNGVKLRGRLRVGGVTTTLIANQGNLNTGTWYHAALTYDGSTVRLYLDGVEVGSAALTGPIDTDPTIPVVVGAQPPGAGGRFFDGLIDDVRILQRAMTPGEIAAIVAGNQAPVATADSYTISEEEQLVVDVSTGVLANDTDGDNDPLTAVLVDDVSNGVLNLAADGSFDYTPALDFAGIDSFTYRANDGNINSNLATVTLTVNGVNDAPVAIDDTYQTSPDSALSVSVAEGVLANDTDVDQDTLQAFLMDDVDHGILTLNTDGSFDYTPDSGFSGTDSFTYRANDGILDSLGVVTINVVSPPTAADDAYVVNEDEILTVPVLTGVLSNDTDNNSTADLSAVLLSEPSNGMLTVFEADGSFAYVPNQDFNGMDSFTYQAVDGGNGAVATATVLLTVNAVNDTTIAFDDAYQMVANTILTVNAANGVLVNDVDVDEDTLQASLVDDVMNGTLALNADGSFTYTPDTDFTGNDGFTYRASDGTFDSLATVVINIEPAVDPNDIAILPLDEGSGTIAGDISGKGNDGALLGGAAFEPTSGDGSSSSVRFDGVNDYIDLGALDVTGTGLTLSCWFNGDAFPGSFSDPRLISKASGTAGNQHVFMLGTISSGGVKLRGRIRVGGVTTTLIANQGNLNTGTWYHAALTYDGSTMRLYLDGLEVGSAALTGPIDTDPTIPVVVGAQPPGAGGRFFDGLIDDVRILQRAMTPGEIAAIVAGNQAPVATADSYTISEEEQLVVDVSTGVLANDTDGDNDPLTAVLVDDVSNGVLNLAADGSFDYTPALDFAGIDSFTYRANDGNINSNLATVTLTVNGVNDAPVAIDDTYQTSPDSALSVSVAEGVLANDTDVDQDTLQAFLMDDVDHGILTLNTDGSFDYTPDSGFSGTDSFTYRANDGILDSLGVVTINVVSPPTAADDAYVVNEDEILTVPVLTGVLSNDTDNNSTADLSAVLLSEPSNGMLTVFEADGSFAYVPNQDFNGMDSFTYQAVDGGNGAVATATVLLTVNAVNDTTIAFDDAYQMVANTILTVNAANGVLVNDVDVDEDTLQASLVDDVMNGTLALNADGSFTYTPDTDFTGNDGFTYRASDGTFDSLATVVINIEPAVDPNDIAILPLDEGSGTIAGDISGKGNDGALLGGAAFEPTSGDGSSSSVRFDGVNDYIDLGALDVTGTGLTLSCWFNGDAFPGSFSDPRLISKASGTAGNQHVFMLGTISSGGVKLRGRIRVGGVTTTLIANQGNLNTGTWYHAALTYDGSTMRLYLDGVEVGSAALTGPIDTDPTIPVVVGAQPPGAGPRFFDGLIDDVYILQRAMSPGEIQDIVAGASGSGARMVREISSDPDELIEEELENREFSVSQNFPNPFTGGTEIRFYLPESEQVEIQVYDLAGRVALRHTLQDPPSGWNSFFLNRAGAAFRDLPEGVYFYKISTVENSEIKRMIISD